MERFCWFAWNQKELAYEKNVRAVSFALINVLEKCGSIAGQRGLRDPGKPTNTLSIFLLVFLSFPFF